MDGAGRRLPGFDQEAKLFWHFRHCHADPFPALLGVHGATFLRQAANSWAAKQTCAAAIDTCSPITRSRSLHSCSVRASK